MSYSKKETMVLNFFLDNPRKEIHIRKISRILNISPNTAKLSLEKLKKDKMILEKKLANLRLFKLNIENKLVIELKKTRNIKCLQNLIKSLKKYKMISVILFGTFAKGTNTQKSDIDLLIIVPKKTIIDLITYKNYELQILQFTPTEWKEKRKKDKAFYKEIITTGIALKGE